MDVRCERCKTEYEFDDAKVTEAGVTVKCTTCTHVFKVKKHSLVVTVPVKPEDAAKAELPPASAPASANAPAREWKVRQSNGNVFSFKELTTLQKWIVERKVKRDDDISLDGQTWKRLGNISELSAFFQVVEEAMKAEQLAALAQAQVAQAQAQVAQASQAQPPRAPTPEVPPQLYSPPPVPTPYQVAAAPTPPPPAADPGPLAAAVVASLPPTTPSAQVVTFPPRADTPAPSAPAPQVVVVQVPTVPQMPAVSDAVRSARREPQSSGVFGKVLVGLIVAGALGAGGYYGYTEVWLKQQQEKQALQSATAAVAARAAMAEQQKQEQEDIVKQLQDEQERLRLEAEEKAKQEAAQPPPLGAAPEAIDASVPAVAATEPAEPVAAEPIVAEPAVAAPPPAAAVKTAATTEKKKPQVKREPRTYTWYMAQGDRLRERERLEAAMDAYGAAADMEPNRAEPVTGRALVLLDMGSKLQAEAAFQQALKLNPSYAMAVMGLAETYRAMGKNQEAMKYYRRYLELLPNGPEAGVARSALERLK